MNIEELKSFKLSDAVKFHNKLNPALWTESDELDSEVKEQLMIIAKDFMSEIGVSSYKVEDITISGSNAAYTYTPHSDLDLHILVDFKKLPDDIVYQELFKAKKTLYNDSHDIKVHGVPVELYVQDSNEPVVSLGEYSLLKNDWIKIPKKNKANFDQNATVAKYIKLGEMIELALKEKNLEKIEKVLDIIKRYRKAGLTATGEFGPENLAFKALRKQGLIQRLWDLKQELHSKELSIENISIKESKKFIEGTNCINCVWWKKNSEKPVGKDELNSNGGLKPPNKEYIAMSKRVDLVTLPGKDTVKVKGFCYHKDINDWVTERMCCAKWDAKGVIRDYKGESPLMEVLDTPAKGIKWDTEDTDLITGKFTASNNIKYNIDILAPYIGPDELDPFDFFSDDQMTDEFYDSARFVEFEQVTRSYKGKQGIEGTGAAAEVFGIVVNGLLSYIKKYKPSMLYFQAVEPNRQNLYKTMCERIVRLLPGWQCEQKGSHFAIYNTKLLNKDKVKEASGYIPSQKQKNDPRYKTALTVDVRPDSIKKNAKAFGFKTSRSGIPPQSKTNGKF
jgi:predicted nucleotidyltransferase